MNKVEYYTYDHIKKVRRILKRRAKRFLPSLGFACRVQINMYDNNGGNVLKTRRIKSRIKPADA